MLILYRLLQQLDLSINPCIAFRRPVTILGEKAGIHTHTHTLSILRKTLHTYYIETLFCDQMEYK